jgi:hypothetical protein
MATPAAVPKEMAVATMMAFLASDTNRVARGGAPPKMVENAGSRPPRPLPCLALIVLMQLAAALEAQTRRALHKLRFPCGHAWRPLGKRSLAPNACLAEQGLGCSSKDAQIADFVCWLASLPVWETVE